MQSRADLELHVERTGRCAECGEATDFDPKITDVYGDKCPACAFAERMMLACDVEQEEGE